MGRAEDVRTSDASMVTEPCCIILAGGLGTRLSSVLPDMPKCLAPVGSRSFLQIQLESLARQGMKSFVLSLGHLAELVLEELKMIRKQIDISIRTVVEIAPLGTGGAALLAMESVGLKEALITNGDTFLGGSLADMLISLDLLSDELARMAVVEVENRDRYGGVLMDEHKVIGFTEKGLSSPGLINAGLYRIHRSAFGGREPGRAFSLESSVLPALATSGNLSGVPIKGEFSDIGIPDDYRKFCRRHGA